MQKHATTQSPCEMCGKPTPKSSHRPPRPVRFCSFLCRNTNNSRIRKRLKGKLCVTCGLHGYRTGDYCEKCIDRGSIARRGIARRTWTDEDLAYLDAHYALDGPDSVTVHLRRGRSAVMGMAYARGLKIGPDAKRLSFLGNGERMRSNNPMKHPETVAKVEAWKASHPEEVAAIGSKLILGKQRYQKAHPNKAEKRVIGMLAGMGVTFEFVALIEPNHLVDVLIGRLVIQLDGNYWHGHPKFEPLTERQQAQQQRDRKQNAFLRSQGYVVVRIWEGELTENRLRAALADHAAALTTLATT